MSIKSRNRKNTKNTKKRYRNKYRTKKIQRGGFRDFGPIKIKKNKDTINASLTIHGIEWMPKQTTKMFKKKKVTPTTKRVIEYRDIQYGAVGSGAKHKIFTVLDKSNNKNYTFSNNCSKCDSLEEFQKFHNTLKYNLSNYNEQQSRLRNLRDKKKRLQLTRRALPPIPPTPLVEVSDDPIVNFGLTDEEFDALRNLPGAQSAGKRKRYSKKIYKRRNSRQNSRRNKKRKYRTSRKYKKNIQTGGGPCNPCKECSIVANKPKKGWFGSSEDIKEFALTKTGLRYRTGTGGAGEVHIVEWNDIAPSGDNIRRLNAESDEEVIIIPIIKDGKPKDLILRLCTRDDCSNRARFFHFKKCLLRLKQLKYRVQPLNVAIEKFTEVVETERRRRHPREEFISKYSEQVDFFKKYRMALVRYAMAIDEERPDMKPEIDRLKGEYQKIDQHNRETTRRVQDVFSR